LNYLPKNKKELKEAKDDIRSNRFATAKEIKVNFGCDNNHCRYSTPMAICMSRLDKTITNIVGRIGESDCGRVPDKYYLQIKEWLKKI